MSVVGLVSRVLPVHAQCATERRALRGRQSGVDLKPPQAAVVKSDGGERCGKAGTRFRQARLREARVPNFGSDRSEADMPRASGACRSGENGPNLCHSTINFAVMHISRSLSLCQI